MTLPDPTPQDWTWVDTFTRQFLGPDYTPLDNAPSLNGQQVTLAQGVAPSPNVPLSIGLAVAPSVWTSANVQVQFDAGRVTTSPDSSVPWITRFGIRLHGATKALIVAGGRVTWGAAELFSAAAPDLPSGTLVRHRITVDTATGRLQMQVGEIGLVDLPLPADFAAEMAGAGTLDVLCHVTPNNISGGQHKTYALLLDSLAIRSGNGQASTDTGTVGGAGAPRLGGLIRFGGMPDDSTGADGDVWVNTGTGEWFRREAGTYTLAMTLLGLPGPQGDPGPAGPKGDRGDPGPPAAGLMSSNPILFNADVTDLILPASQHGGLDGYLLLGVDGPALSVEASPDGVTWTPVTYPFTVPPLGRLRINRQGGQGVSTLRALAPLQAVEGGGGETPGGLTSSADEQGFITLHGATVTTDADGYQTITNAEGTTDPDGYVTVPATPAPPPTDPGGMS